jgi:hypothetical protein
MKQVAGTCRRMFSSKVLKERLEEIIPQKQALLKEIKKNYGHETLETVLPFILGDSRPNLGRHAFNQWTLPRYLQVGRLERNHLPRLLHP